MFRDEDVAATLDTISKNNMVDQFHVSYYDGKYDIGSEKSNPVADIAQLGRLVHWTESFGGKLVEPRELPALLQELGREPPELEIEVEVRWQLGKTRADAWTYFLLIVVLVSSEWYLRKKWGMV